MSINVILPGYHKGSIVTKKVGFFNVGSCITMAHKTFRIISSSRTPILFLRMKENVFLLEKIEYNVYEQVIPLSF